MTLTLFIDPWQRKVSEADRESTGPASRARGNWQAGQNGRGGWASDGIALKIRGLSPIIPDRHLLVTKRLIKYPG
ncbi:MAG: hypothetical protein LH481_12010, partial [Burkholderiales bacterium]|nr:hypothetical protein [Burkholderiales bacterium]